MTDSESDDPVRLDQIVTSWTLIRRAHQAETKVACEARGSLVLRYSLAVRGYVRAIMRNDETADEVAQDVVVRILQGDFAGADPGRGRFRDFLKVVVRNMVRNEWAKRNRRRPVDLDVQQADILEQEPSDSDPFLDAWRQNLLDLTWAALEDYQNRHAGSQVFTVLQLRFQHPEDSSQQLAERLSQVSQREIRPDALRQQLKRARQRFRELLIREVADGLDNPTAERVEEELIALGLHQYVRESIDRD